MKKSELKALLKPLIKECIKESILEEGILSNVIMEVTKGLDAYEFDIASVIDPAHNESRLQGVLNCTVEWLT